MRSIRQRQASEGFVPSTPHTSQQRRHKHRLNPYSPLLHKPPIGQWLNSHARQCRCHAQQNQVARAFRPVPIKIITVSKGNSKGANAMAEEWRTKLQRYTPVTEVQIKPNPKGTADPELQKAAEADKVVKAVSPGERVVVLDERGRELQPSGFAELLADAGDTNTPLTFCIGGPFGHGTAVRERANDSIRLSSLVLNHSVAHVVLLEQLYRGYEILRGTPYHH